MPFSLSSNRVARYTGSKTSTTPRTTPVMIAPVQAFHTRMGSEVDVELDVDFDVELVLEIDLDVG